MELDSKYPKIQTLYKRDGRGKIILGEYSMPEFATKTRNALEEYQTRYATEAEALAGHKRICEKLGVEVKDGQVN